MEKSADNKKIKYLRKLKFCVAHVNYFFKSYNNLQQVEYFPAEYALGLFSLKNGIIDVHHTIVGADIPLGYRYEALKTSRDFHRIPIELKDAETDFKIMYAKLIKFLEPHKLDNKYPVIYAPKFCINHVRSLFDKLSNAVEQDKNQFIINKLENLYEYIANEAYKTRANRKIKSIPTYSKKIFIYAIVYACESSFECPFHKYTEEGFKVCSKSFLQQWAWVFCHEFCEPFKVKMQSRVHTPVTLNLNLDFETKMRNLHILSKEDIDKSDESILISITLPNVYVNEQSIVKSSRTYDEDVRHRHESEPVIMIHSNPNDNSTNVSADLNITGDTSLDKFANLCIEDEKESNFLDNIYIEKQEESPNLCICTGIQSYEGFSRIGGRGMSLHYRKRRTKRSFGRGRGHLNPLS